MWMEKAFFSSPLHREGFPLADRLCWSDSRDGLGAKGALGFALPLGLELLEVRGEGQEEGMRRALGWGSLGDLLSSAPDLGAKQRAPGRGQERSPSP